MGIKLLIFIIFIYILFIMNLQEYITKSLNESLSRDIKTMLMDIINNDSMTDDIAKKMIRVYDHESIDINGIISHLNDVGLGKNTDEIIDFLRHDRHDFLRDYSSIVSTGDFVTTKELLSNDNIYDLLSKKYPSIPRELIHKLVVLNYPDNEGIARGKFEILLDMFLDDITPGNTGRADVNTRKYGFELKASGARMGSKSHSPVNIDMYIKDVLAKNEIKYSAKNCLGNEAAVTDTYSQLSSCMDPKLAFIEMMRAVFNQYTITTVVNGSNLKVNGYPDISCDIDDLYNKVFKNGKFVARSFKRVQGCIALSVYSHMEGWDYMMVFKGSDSKNVAERGDYFFISSDEAKDINDLYDDNRFNLSKGGKEDNFDKYSLLTSTR